MIKSVIKAFSPTPIDDVWTNIEKLKQECATSMKAYEKDKMDEILKGEEERRITLQRTKNIIEREKDDTLKIAEKCRKLSDNEEIRKCREGHNVHSETIDKFTKKLAENIILYGQLEKFWSEEKKEIEKNKIIIDELKKPNVYNPKDYTVIVHKLYDAYEYYDRIYKTKQNKNVNKIKLCIIGIIYKLDYIVEKYPTPSFGRKKRKSPKRKSKSKKNKRKSVKRV